MIKIIKDHKGLASYDDLTGDINIHNWCKNKDDVRLLSYVLVHEYIHKLIHESVHSIDYLLIEDVHWPFKHGIDETAGIRYKNRLFSN